MRHVTAVTASLWMLVCTMGAMLQKIKDVSGLQTNMSARRLCGDDIPLPQEKWCFSPKDTSALNSRRDTIILLGNSNTVSELSGFARLSLGRHKGKRRRSHTK